jgi:hypothetical protein
MKNDTQMIMENWRRFLNEDLDSFLRRSEPRLATKDDPLPRDIKRMWNEEADHQFFDGLTKVHWIRRVEDLQYFDRPSGRDELSVSLYLPGGSPTPPGAWMEPGVGVQLRGRITLAANDMGSLVTGYRDELEDKPNKNTSGAVRRAAGRKMTREYLSDYILDAGSFKNGSRANEGVIDNWKPIGIILTDVGSFNEDTVGEVERIMSTSKYLSNLPILQ